MGPHLRARDDAAAWLRGAGPGTLLGSTGALPAVMRRLQHADLHSFDAGADVSPVAPADDTAVSQTADHHQSKEPAAAQGIGVLAGGSRQRRIPGGDSGCGA